MTLSWGGLIVTAFHFYGSLDVAMSGFQLAFNYALMGFFVGAIATTPIVSTRAFLLYIEKIQLLLRSCIELERVIMSCS